MPHDNPSTPGVDRVARAIEIYRSIAACNEQLARNDGVHALTAAVMRPCYAIEFEKLARQLTRAEEAALTSALRQFAPLRQA